MIPSDIEGHDILQHQITRKQYKAQLHLHWETNRKLYTVNQMVPFSVTLNDS